MKRVLLLVLAVGFCVVARQAHCQVFVDDFNDADGTLLNGKAPDVGGGNWNVSTGAGGLDVQSGAVDTVGAGRAAFGPFNDTLSAGETLQFNFDTVDTAGTMFSGGFAGVSLYEGGAGGTERVFIGDRGDATFWGLDQSGLNFVSANDNETASAQFVYQYNTGDYAFSLDGSQLDSGSVSDGFPLNTLRFANGSGGDIAVAGLTATVASTLTDATVFADDFSDADGTNINGKASDIGRGWTGSDLNITGNTLDTTGAARTIFGEFADTLSAGERLDLSFTTEDVSGNNFFSGGFAGVSLYDDEGVEQIFIGDRSDGVTWGLAGASGADFLSAVSDPSATVDFHYDFDSGDYQFFLDGVLLDSGTIAAELELDSLRVANNNGGDIALSNISVAFAVPEPLSLSLWAMGGMLVIGVGAIRIKRNGRRAAA